MMINCHVFVMVYCGPYMGQVTIYYLQKSRTGWHFWCKFPAHDKLHEQGITQKISVSYAKDNPAKLIKSNKQNSYHIFPDIYSEYPYAKKTQQQILLYIHSIHSSRESQVIPAHCTSIVFFQEVSHCDYPPF